MGRQVSLFSTYKQAENRETNYTLLVLRLIYEESPRALAGILSSLISEDLAEHIGVKFQQQLRKKESVPDGEIRQSGFLLYIESKRHGTFRTDQLKNHANALASEDAGTKVLLALSAEEDEPAFEDMKSWCSGMHENQIVFVGATYGDLLGAIGEQDLSPGVKAVVNEYREFVSSQNLLPDWETRLDVVNCATSWENIAQGGAYFCPTEGGAYSHRRSKYFGMYRKKGVEFVAEIEGVVDADAADESVIVWKNANITDQELKIKAVERLLEQKKEFPRRVFVLGRGLKTHFVKDSKGGMLGSKKYFDVAKLDPQDVSDLAAKLENRKWSEFA